MRTAVTAALLTVWIVVAGTPLGAAAGPPPGKGWAPLFNGKDLAGWKVPEGDNGHWKVVDGVIDYDARSEAKGDKNLWTEESFESFVLRIDWRLKQTTGLYLMPTILPDGSYKKDESGKVIEVPRPNADSGIFLRGYPKAQLNIWCWPAGSGEIWGYRNDQKMPPEVRAGATPKLKADKPVGEWNTFEITLRGARLTVLLNDKTVIEKARLPGLPPSGPIGLQHHGGFNAKTGEYSPASSLIQFRNIYLRKLPAQRKAKKGQPRTDASARSATSPTSALSSLDFGVPGVERSEPPVRKNWGFAALNPSHPDPHSLT